MTRMRPSAAPSSANATAPISTRRLLTVGTGLGTCNILPPCGSRDSTVAADPKPDARLPLTAAALAYRG